MKKMIMVCLGSVLLAGCAGSTHTTPFESRFSCEIPKSSDYPVVSSKADLLTNMKRLGERAESANFVSGQWMAQTPDAAGKEKIKECSAEILVASEAIISPQYESVKKKTVRADERAILTEVYRSWDAYMRSITLNGVDNNLRDAFKAAAEKYVDL